MGEFGLVADDVQQQVNGELTLRLRSAALPERHPSMGTTQENGILVPAVTNRQIEPQDHGGELDVVIQLSAVLWRKDSEDQSGTKSWHATRCRTVG